MVLILGDASQGSSQDPGRGRHPALALKLRNVEAARAKEEHHVVQLLNQALETLRREEPRSHPEPKKTRYL